MIHKGEIGPLIEVARIPLLNLDFKANMLLVEAILIYVDVVSFST